MEVVNSSASLLPLDTDEGKTLLQESRFTGLLPYFFKQVNRKYCGLCSTAICLNEILDTRRLSDLGHVCEVGLKISKILQAKERTIKSLRESDVLSLGEESGVFSQEEVDLKGITLDTYGRLIDSLGLQSRVFHAFVARSENSESITGLNSPDGFRTVVLEHLKTPGSHAVVNFDLSVFYDHLKGPSNVQFGHFSPLGGYHVGRDMFLLLDVWPRNPVCWVATQDLFNAMISEDSCSHMPRGFCLIKPGDILENKF